ncbi:lytic transglycosylase domain-containing protein [Caldanaerobacter subterraneus]|uniref:Lytic transglycosylase domain-containing protein n=2 Tax=Caldanaerobacter subterraneus TaxID=911092 RepID=A0A7Y2PLU3_9THEO|nr:lytic transglycosylase domain-containing protein [Caldanaerobacter subterraneus]
MRSLTKKYGRKLLLSLFKKIAVFLFTTPPGWVIIFILLGFFSISFFITAFSYMDFTGSDDEALNQSLYQKYISLSDSSATTEIEKNYKLPWEVIAAIDMVYNVDKPLTVDTSLAQDITDNLKPVFHYKEVPVVTTVKTTLIDQDGKPQKSVTTTSTSNIKILDRVEAYNGTYILKYTKSQSMKKETKENEIIETITEEYNLIGDEFLEDYTRLDKYLKKINLYQDKDLIITMIEQFHYAKFGTVLPASITNLPQEYIDIYKRAAKAYNVDWWILAAIHGVETTFSQDLAVSSAGAVGHMQFMPLTWSGYNNPYASTTKYDTDPERIKKYGGYGVDANNDGKADPYDLEDAVFAAAKYLSANGYLADPRKAIYAYNHAWWYVDKVMEYASAIKLAYEDGVSTFTYSSNVEEAKNNILTSGKVSFDPSALDDIKNNRADGKVILLIDAISKQYPIYISSIKSNHSKYVAGTSRISLHYLGKAFDIAAVDGIPVISQRYIGSPAFKISKMLVTSAGQLGIAEVGSPWDFGGVSFTDEGHQNHIHVGVK